MSLSETNIRKFNQLQDICIERFVTREQKILTTLNFCITALEKLEGWAVFAIFPTDELDGEKYLLFVEERFSCVSAQLNNFKNIINVKPDGLKNKKQNEKNANSESKEANKGVTMLPLKEKVSEISQRYLRDGYQLKSAIIEKLQQCRQQLNTLFHWCFATLRDLDIILDEPMIDELFFLVKSKASRISSTIQVYEEAANEIKMNMSEPAQTSSRSRSSLEHSKTFGSSSKLDNRSSSTDIDLTKSYPVNMLKTKTKLSSIKKQPSSVSPSSLTLMNSSDSSTLSNCEIYNFGSEGDGSKFSSSGSTPEPPFSPRPENLINHPKINKDQQLKSNFKNDSCGQLNNL
ncbi:hypothetical protein HELRODRAFT_162358 [Helobdella robusta]|uniref:Uncharacterized protein n=1 Tax=Helobdella robusta TaxID=6412 RepID=T1ESJ9_HELRO|nr:hypothetical protein HELRODRAFT_162358 [Helobdella robusta]ESN98892.1 hypothetical protein HELRODRAFT_162358 [Helobdella robusta]